MQSNDEAPADQRRLTLILFNVCVGQFIVGLDQRALLVALPTLTHTFNTSLTTIQWVLLIYDLLLIGTVITVGRLGDLFGRALWRCPIGMADHPISRFAGGGRGDDLG
jgi:MFS family permease